MANEKYIVRDISWLSFNERVLQEAADPETPLIERLKFLGIFSSNLDEFFRVRVATIKRMAAAGKKARALIGDYPEEILNDIQHIVLEQQDRIDIIFQDILRELRTRGIFLVNETQLTPAESDFAREYFHGEVRARLFPLMLDYLDSFPELDDHSIYLAVRLLKKETSEKPRHSLIAVPSDVLSRFVVLPRNDGEVRIILLDDIIRVGLEDIFSSFDFRIFDAYTIKLTRDAELDIEDDITISFMENISKSLKKRERGAPVRFVYDARIPEPFLKSLMRRLKLSTTDTQVPGGRYHNLKDFMGFPAVGKPDLRYAPLPSLPHPDLGSHGSVMAVMRNKDILLNYPFHTFNHFIDLLREASIDPKVVSIKISLYRLARNSNVVNALINAARNGKQVMVVMELQARFDEKANIYWADRMMEEGVKLLYGVPDLKVHAKLLLITRREQGNLMNYVNVSTGNYNEATARIYSDHSYFTTDKRISDEVEKTFRFFERNYRTASYEHLLVAPFSMRDGLCELIDREKHNAKKGRPAWIRLKLNSLSDTRMIDKLYSASQAGVKIEMIIRGICCLVPGVPGLSENISAISIVDRFLEHSRIFAFCNNNQPKYFISSADLMDRNLDRRVEIICPIYDNQIQNELAAFLDLQFRDSVKARVLDGTGENRYRRLSGQEPVRSQLALYEMHKAKYDNGKKKREGK